MSIRKIQDNETWFCDSVYLNWSDLISGFVLETIEGSLFRDEDCLHWIDLNGKLTPYAEYTEPLTEPHCPNCDKPSWFEYYTNEEGKMEFCFCCQCHRTKGYNTPEKAWKGWKRWCNYV